LAFLHTYADTSVWEIGWTASAHMRG
jgi:hypothetical protein